MFPKLEGQMSSRMKFQGREVLVWSINNYLGLGNLQDVRDEDTEATKEWGLAMPMGARMMTGETNYHNELEKTLADFVGKESAYVLNYGYQGVMSIIDSLVDRKDVIVYDSEAHACIIDGARLHMGKRFVYAHNDMEKLEKQLQHATKYAEKTGGGVILVTEGVYGMSGDLANLKAMVDLKKKYNFRLVVDDAHGFGTMGERGAGTGEHFGVQDEVDVYISTFAKSMSGIGGFVASKKHVIRYLMYNMRSQVFAKSLPIPMVKGVMKRMEYILNGNKQKDKLWTIVNALQKGLKEAGFNLGNTQSPVTPVFLSGTVAEATNLSYDLRETYGIFTSLVAYPVVPRGVILIRLIPTAMHTLEDVDYTIKAFKAIKEKLDEGAYASEEMKDAHID
ncbi:MAG: pyridoxal phosphate-dependent aminotransferase family protein [Bacteroidales bacterium]|nr:pyridoxal phosphate-dependent aminotransferase family protein [Bacteroidales bacterium]MCF8332809.1 pyridoxal phosphate-dependent aminotransferase family protein [Bacteroidales bacterium]